MRYYYTYKITCTAVGWEDYYYLGQHITTDLTDGYKGSGKELGKYYEKYPDDYTFTILEFYSNKTELNIAEQKLIGDLWKTDPYCLNCTSGGTGGSWSRNLAIAHENRRGKSLSEETKRKLSETLKGKKKPKRTQEHSLKISNSLKGKIGPNKGKKFSEDHKRKISETKRGASPSPNKGRHRVYREDGSYYMSAE